MFKKYFDNSRIFKCPECGRYFELNFWQWLNAQHLPKHRRVKCPYCKQIHWLQAEKKK